MAEKITVPTLGESVTEATVSKWLKSKGEKVSADEPLVELETDKVNVEVPSPISGVLGNIAVKEGETVNVGSLLGTVDGSSASKENIINEVNNYNPPIKEKEKFQPKVFEEEKIIKPKKIKAKKSEEPILKLEEEEPLILEQVHEEKTFSYEFEPDEDEILEDLLPKNISTQVFKALLENAASEQGSRMTAMDNATRNAGDLVDKLTINYNRSRQASITKELIEIISGAESL